MDHQNQPANSTSKTIVLAFKSYASTLIALLLLPLSLCSVSVGAVPLCPRDGTRGIPVQGVRTHPVRGPINNVGLGVS